MQVPSFAKINWTLEILGRRPDGYHELRTILQTVDVHDDLTFTLAESQITLTCNNPAVPCDGNNLIFRAALLLREFTGCDKGANIHLTKRIPIGAGLGGGSSNAAVALLTLINLWGLDVAPQDLFALGAKLGADVPFFFFGGTGIGIGRGDEVYPMEDMTSDYLLLVNPGINVPTKEIYGNLPSMLTRTPALNKIPHSLAVAYAHNMKLPLQLRNDLEVSALSLFPEIGAVKQRLTDLNATQVLMSGSGSTVFAVFESEAACVQAKLQMPDWWCEKTRTLDRDTYQAAIRFFRNV